MAKEKNNNNIQENENIDNNDDMYGADFILDYIEEQGIYLRE